MFGIRRVANGIRLAAEENYMRKSIDFYDLEDQDMHPLFCSGVRTRCIS
jgi:hypothetical protein